ncbi:MAG: ComEA family DNA-binding protein [Betaproteobacteria bacterium]|nr:ComEA family DNA-binding protein [Betaproteobacteria bacterium]
MQKILLVIFLLFVFSGFSNAAVNINTATQAELETIQGIGPARAKAIIEYREKEGNFASEDDLVNVNGIGRGTVKKLRRGGISVGSKQVEEREVGKK